MLAGAVLLLGVVFVLGALLSRARRRALLRTVGDPAATGIAWKNGRSGFYADDYGVMVRNSWFPARRFAWTEIGCFADGSWGDRWRLDIVLHTGQRVPVICTAGQPVPVVVAAVRRVAERYGIPADLAGVPMKDGRPAQRRLYQDPGGQPGLRFWDGTQWSPLLPPDIIKPRYGGGFPKGPSTWSVLPTADGRWTYAATQARRWTAVFVVSAAVSAALLIAGLVIEVRWDHGALRGHMRGSLWLTLSSLAALWAYFPTRTYRKLFQRLDNAVKRASNQ
jgi:hypothetical protein